MTDISWRKNLYAIFIAELIVVIGMNFVSPFMPLFVQELGNFSNREAALWAGLATGASGIAMFLSAPFWGILADRSGRRPMLLRAMFGTAVVVALTGFAPNVYFLVILRFAMGVLSGTFSATLALVSTTTPRDKIAFAMALISLAKFGGGALGPLGGGSLADNVGFKNTFFISAAIVLAGGLIVFFFTREKFEQPAQIQAFSLRNVWRLAISRQMLPILMVEFALIAGQQMMAPIIPLVIRELDPGGAAATQSGLAFGLMALIAGVAALVTGRLGGYISLKKILVFSCLAGSVLYLPPIWAGTATQLVILVALIGVPKGGLITSASALIGLSVSQSQQGMAYGVVQSAKALGSGLGPLLGGSLAQFLGLRPVFGVAAGFFALASVLVTKQLAEQPSRRP